VRPLQSDWWHIPEFTQCSRCKQHETESSLVCSGMKQSNARVSSRSAADSKHGVRRQRKLCHQSSDSFLVRPSRSYLMNAAGKFILTQTNYLPHGNGIFKFAVCLPVCLFWRISSATAERIWLKFCAMTEVCLDTASRGDRSRGPCRGAENVPWESLALTKLCC